MRYVSHCAWIFVAACVLIAASSAVGVAAAVGAAESPGQSDLDKAFEARLTAKSLAEVGEVIELCRGAIKKGLDAENEKFAKQLLASSLFQQGELLSNGVLDATRPDPRLPQIRLMALSYLEEALALDGELPEARLLIARLNLFAGGDLKKARSMLDAVVASKTADGDSRADAYTFRSQLRDSADERLADLDEALDLNPESAQAYRLRAAVKLSQNKAAEAVADFDSALEIDPDSAATHEARGLALAAQQKWDEAKKSLSRAVELFPKASGAMLQRGRIAMLAGDPKSAVADADAVLKLVPDLAEALLLRSHAKYADGDKAGALADVGKVLDRMPTSSQALRTRITIFVGDQKLAEAVNDLETLARAEPEAADVVLQLAALENTLKRSRRAVERLDGLIQKDPKNWRARRIRGDALLGQGKHKDAIADFEAALKSEPKDSGILNNLAWVLATSPDDDVRDGKRAVELAEKACAETEYKQAHILSTLAAAHAELGDFTTAKKWSEKALEAADDDVKENLRKELENYRSEKPWRERFTESAEAPTPERK